MRVALAMVMVLIAAGNLLPRTAFAQQSLGIGTQLLIHPLCDLAAFITAGLAFRRARRPPAAARQQAAGVADPQAIGLKDFAPAIAFVGGEVSSPEDAAGIRLNAQRRLAAERARRPNYASVVMARCQNDGTIAASLYRATDLHTAIWTNVVGNIPVTFVPKSSVWTMEDVRKTEPAVIAAVEKALAC